MSKDKIEWDLVRGDEIGMRNIDLWVSAIVVIAFTWLPLLVPEISREDTERYAIVASLGFLAIISFSALQSYNRDTFARYYYFFGLVGFLLRLLDAKRIYLAKNHQDLNHEHYSD